MNTFLVSDVIHKAVIEVNEEGSEAAAVTAVIIQSRSASRRRSIRFDRPFFFILQDKKHCLKLFVGRVVDPSGINQIENSPIQKDFSKAQEKLQIFDPKSTVELGKKQDPRLKDNHENLQQIDRKIKIDKRKDFKNKDNNIGPKKAKNTIAKGGKDDSRVKNEKIRKTKRGKKENSKIEDKNGNLQKIVPNKIAKGGKEDSRVENKPKNLQPIDPNIREFCGKYFKIQDIESKGSNEYYDYYGNH